MILYFDTETSSLMPGRIIQLAYVMCGDGEKRAKNFYFYTSYIDPSASDIHGITPEKLAMLSEGHTFSEFADEIYDDFISADLIISHNFDFDLRFMTAEFDYLDRTFRYREALCSMRYFTSRLRLPRPNGRGYKYPKLDELSEHFDIYPYDISMETLKLFGEAGAGHDARYDTVEMMLSVEASPSEFPEVGDILNKYSQNMSKDA